MNKIEISNPKISQIHCIDTPPNPTSNNMLAIVDLGANINLSKQSTTTIYPVILSNEIISRLIDGSTMESLHISIIQLSSLSKQARQIHILPKIKTAPLI